MSDIGDVQIQVNGQWVDLNEWLRTHATAEEVEQIAGKGKGTWVAQMSQAVQSANDFMDGLTSVVATAGVTVAEFEEAFATLSRTIRSNE